MAKEGSTISGLMDSFATMTSLALQHGVPLQLLVDKFTHTRFEPSGFTKNPEIPMAKSIMDYIFKWLAIKFLSRDSQESAGVILREEPAPAKSAPPNVTPPSAQDLSFIDRVTTATATPITTTPAPALPEPGKVVGRRLRRAARPGRPRPLPRAPPGDRPTPVLRRVRAPARRAGAAGRLDRALRALRAGRPRDRTAHGRCLSSRSPARWRS
jgi:hypothetical protein